ncbi:DMT family transporter [Candidatus Dojkabacteria bacterium]|uniref:DMT family transporter n=1 Tax=Candidatus Dojkabacteria bacterium TaxID=2099670 RepID=A0A955L8W9_9BACT|nr:DMT family transporter [Candidatus Dojkabacteria bacterium]
MSYIYYVILSVTLYSFASLIRKKVSDHGAHLNYIYTILFQLLGGVSVFAFSLMFGFGSEYSGYWSTLEPYFIWKMLLAGVLWFGSTLVTFKALNYISASKFSVIETLSPITSMVFAFMLLGESITMLQAGGIVLILMSVFMVTYDRKDKFTRFSGGELLAVAASMISGLALVNDKGIYENLALAPTLVILFLLPGVIAIIAKPRELKKITNVLNKESLIYLLSMSTIWGCAAIFYYKAIVVSHSVSLVVSLGQLSTIITVLLGLVILKEYENWGVKIAAGILSFIGLIVISI